jgi:hypothetical protein
MAEQGDTTNPQSAILTMIIVHKQLAQLLFAEVKIMLLLCY